jgi:hypothetical protein
MKPSIGRIVHYRSDEDECRAAVVTEVSSPDRFDEPDTETVSLFALKPNGAAFYLDVRHDETSNATGTWHWPERVE